MLNGPPRLPGASHMLALPAIDLAAIRVAALAGDVLALAEVTTLHTLSGAPDRPRERHEWPLPFEPGALALSPSGRLALVTAPARNQAAVLDLHDGTQLIELGGPDARPHSLAATFASTRARELLVLSRERFVLEALTLPDLRVHFRSEALSPQPFVFDSLHALPDGDTVVAIGHGESEGKDSLATLSLAALAADASWLPRELRERTRPADYAYRLAAGPWESGGMVVFRDPEEDEAEEDEAPSPEPDVWNFRGLYTRRLGDGALVDRVAWDGPIPSGAPLFADPRWIVVGAPGRVQLISRVGGGTATTLDAAVYAFDPAASRIVTIQGSDAAVHDLEQYPGAADAARPEER